MQSGAEVWPHQMWSQGEEQGEQLLAAAQVPISTRVAGNTDPEQAWGNLRENIQPKTFAPGWAPVP